jgi:hypothetical protein
MAGHAVLIQDGTNISAEVHLVVGAAMDEVCGTKQ